MLTLLIPPIVICLGCAVGVAVSLLATRVRALQTSSIRIPAIALTVAVVVQAAMLGIEALRYNGACSGWGERGQHPCSRLEFVLQDWELSLIFSAIPTILAIALALFVSSRSGSRELA